jgi:hypothetical protein
VVSDLSNQPGLARELPTTERIIIDADPGSSVYAVLLGDMHIRNGYPVYQVMPYPLDALPLPGGKARQQPSRLLAADSRVVPFSGRIGELDQLETQCHLGRADKQPVGF